jgi:hypothetical protein
MMVGEGGKEEKRREKKLRSIWVSIPYLSWNTCALREQQTLIDFS